MKNTIIMSGLLMMLALTTASAQQKRAAAGTTPAHLKAAAHRTAAAAPQQAPRKVYGLSSTQRPIGYTTTDDIDNDDVYLGAAGTYPLGVYVDKSMLKPYTGCKIIGIRFAVGQSIDRTSVFYYKVDDSGTINEAPVSQTQKTYEGWNNVFFNDANVLEITGEENLLFGYNYIESAKMASEEHGAICTVGEETGNDFLIYARSGSNEGWYTVSDCGKLCAQLIVDISSLPSKDISIGFADAGFLYKQKGEDLEGYVTFVNSGRETVESIQVGYQLDSQAPVTNNIEKRLAPGAETSWEPVISLGEDVAMGKHTVRFFIASADGEQLASFGTKETSFNFYLYSKPIQRQKNYVEQYTSQNSYYGPTINSLFEEALKAEGHSVLVNIYEPGNPLALKESNYLTSLYAFTYPCFSCNRALFPGEPYVAYDITDYALGELGAIASGVLADLMRQDYVSAAFATIDLQPSYNEATRQLDISFSGTLSEEFKAIFGDVGVTLMLTEDQVKGVQYDLSQNGSTYSAFWDYNYMHDHVLRAYATSPTGDRIVANGQTFSGQVSTTLNANWNPANMHLIGIVTRYADTVDANNLTEMDVVGCNSYDLSLLTNGIDVPTQAQDGTIRYYNLQGQPVDSSQLAPGIYIERSGNHSRKVLRR